MGVKCKVCGEWLSHPMFDYCTEKCYLKYAIREIEAERNKHLEGIDVTITITRRKTEDG